MITGSVSVIYIDGTARPAPDAGTRLLDWIRDSAATSVPKEGCGAGHCGACTVLLDTEPVFSCSVLAIAAFGRHIWTAAALSRTGTGKILCDKLLEHGAIQCGFCAPGMVAMGVAWLRGLDAADDRRASAVKALNGNLCRCSGYSQILDAFTDAARSLGDSES